MIATHILLFRNNISKRENVLVLIVVVDFRDSGLYYSSVFFFSTLSRYITKSFHSVYIFVALRWGYFNGCLFCASDRQILSERNLHVRRLIFLTVYWDIERDELRTEIIYVIFWKHYSITCSSEFWSSKLEGKPSLLTVVHNCETFQWAQQYLFY